MAGSANTIRNRALKSCDPVHHHPTTSSSPSNIPSGDVGMCFYYSYALFFRCAFLKPTLSRKDTVFFVLSFAVSSTCRCWCWLVVGIREAVMAFSPHLRMYHLLLLWCGVCVAFRGNCHRVLIVIEGGVWICFFVLPFPVGQTPFGPAVVKAVEGVFIALLRY